MSRQRRDTLLTMLMLQLARLLFSRVHLRSGGRILVHRTSKVLVGNVEKVEQTSPPWPSPCLPTMLAVVADWTLWYLLYTMLGFLLCFVRKRREPTTHAIPREYYHNVSIHIRQPQMNNTQEQYRQGSGVRAILKRRGHMRALAKSLG